jgi:CRISPR-associated endonuclease Csn1
MRVIILKRAQKNYYLHLKISSVLKMSMHRLFKVSLSEDYGSLSAKAIRKILPHLKDGLSYGGRKSKPTEPSAVEYAGYGNAFKGITHKRGN